MTQSQKLRLPYILAAQAQKHITHNEALRQLDSLLQLTVNTRTLSTPPSLANDGAHYIIGMDAKQQWKDKEGQIAAWQDNSWFYYQPQPGWRCWILDEQILVVFNGINWEAVHHNTNSDTNLASVNPAHLVGVNAVADVTNKLAVKSDAVLFSHDDITPGTGDAQAKINKATASNTASFLFQNDFSGRAEVGLTGDDDLHFKVSDDGSSWHEAINVDRATGAASFPSTPLNNNLLSNPDFAINQRSFDGGVLTANSYGHDRWKASNVDANYTVDSSGVVSLSAGSLVQVLENPGLDGKSVTFSVEDLSGGNLVFQIAGQTGTIIAGTGRKFVTLSIPVAQTGDITLKISPQSGGTISFVRPKLEIGLQASQWFPVDVATEYQRALRYFYRLDIAGYSEILTGRVHSSSDVRALINLPAVMRDAPSVLWGGDFIHWAASAGGVFSYVTSITFWAATTRAVTLKLAVAGLPDKRATAVRQGSAVSSWVTFDAEL